MAAVVDIDVAKRMGGSLPAVGVRRLNHRALRRKKLSVDVEALLPKFSGDAQSAIAHMAKSSLILGCETTGYSAPAAPSSDEVDEVENTCDEQDELAEESLDLGLDGAAPDIEDVTYAVEIKRLFSQEQQQREVDNRDIERAKLEHRYLSSKKLMRKWQMEQAKQTHYSAMLSTKPRSTVCSGITVEAPFTRREKVAGSKDKVTIETYEIPEEYYNWLDANTPSLTKAGHPAGYVDWLRDTDVGSVKVQLTRGNPIMIGNTRVGVQFRTELVDIPASYDAQKLWVAYAKRNVNSKKATRLGLYGTPVPKVEIVEDDTPPWSDHWDNFVGPTPAPVTDHHGEVSPQVEKEVLTSLVLNDLAELDELRNKRITTIFNHSMTGNWDDVVDKVYVRIEPQVPVFRYIDPNNIRNPAMPRRKYETYTQLEWRVAEADRVEQRKHDTYWFTSNSAFMWGWWAEMRSIQRYAEQVEEVQESLRLMDARRMGMLDAKNSKIAEEERYAKHWRDVASSEPATLETALSVMEARRPSLTRNDVFKHSIHGELASDTRNRIATELVLTAINNVQERFTVRTAERKHAANVQKFKPIDVKKNPYGLHNGPTIVGVVRNDERPKAPDKPVVPLTLIEKSNLVAAEIMKQTELQKSPWLDINITAMLKGKVRDVKKVGQLIERCFTEHASGLLIPA